MNILLWILQILLALWNLSGGIFTALNYEKLTSPMASALPKPVWVAIGVLQAAFALGLIVPGAIGLPPKLTVIAATYLTINALAGCVLFSKYAGFPGLLWGVIPAILTAFVAYQRMP